MPKVGQFSANAFAIRRQPSAFHQALTPSKSCRCLNAAPPARLKFPWISRHEDGICNACPGDSEYEGGAVGRIMRHHGIARR